MNGQRPNIVIICTDEQRGDHLGCMPARATMLTGLTNRASGVRTQGISLADDVPTLPGEALTPVVTGDASPRRKNALIEYDDETHEAFECVQYRSLVTNDWKLVFYAPTNETMLFDRKNDPDELNNLASDPAHQPVVATMFKQLTQELSRTDRRLPRFLGS